MMKRFIALSLLFISTLAFSANEYKQPNPALFYNYVSASKYKILGTDFILSPATGNSFLGEGAGNLSPGANYNSAFGYHALNAISSGSGLNAAYGVNSLNSLSSGSEDTAIGVNSCTNVSSASASVCIGYGSDVGNFSASLALGTNAVAGANNVVMFGQSGVNVGIGNVNSSIPTARLHIPAGTATAGTAPLKIAHGTIMSSPEADAIENDGTNLWYTTSGSSRSHIVTATASIADGGTGQTSAPNGFKALSPQTTKGDVISFDGSVATRIPVGSNGQVLTADSTQTSGVKWGAGGGGGGGINFVGLNTSFVLTSSDDVNGETSVGNWLAYADAAGSVPVDMTGGSPTTTCLRTTTAGHVLNGAGSLEMVVSSGNYQGEGCSVLVNVPPGYRGQNTMFQMSFSVNAGTYVSGDLIMAVYDVTNSQLLSVSGASITGTGLLQANLVIPSTTTQVRIGLHRAVTTSAAVTVDFDDVILGPPNNIGKTAIADDWKKDLTFTPSAGFGTISAADYRYKRIGDMMLVRGYFKSGTTAGSTCSIALPTGYTIDSSKLTSTTNAQQVGWGSRIATSGTPISMFQASDNHVYFYDGSDTANVYLARQSASNALTKFNCSSDYSNSDGATFEFSVPITQWASTGTSFRADTVANSWSGYHDNTCSWTVTSTSYADFALDASCALAERVNRNFGTVSTSGSVKPAITFTPTRLGAYQVCVAGTVADATIAKLVALRLWDGTTVIAERDFVQAVATDGTNFSFCGLYKATSLSAVTLSLQGQSDAGALTLAAVRATTALEWSIMQIDQQIPAPLLVNSVTSEYTGVQRIERFYMSAVCTTGTCALGSSTPGISSVTFTSTGIYAVNFTAGTFSAAPTCVLNSIHLQTVSDFCSTYDPTSTSSTVAKCYTTAAALSNEAFDGICMGPH